MHCLSVMLATTDCFLFILKLKQLKNKNIYEIKVSYQKHVKLKRYWNFQKGGGGGEPKKHPLERVYYRYFQQY